jgi:hypothetical protein
LQAPGIIKLNWHRFGGRIKWNRDEQEDPEKSPKKLNWTGWLLNFPQKN